MAEAIGTSLAPAANTTPAVALPSSSSTEAPSNPLPPSPAPEFALDADPELNDLTVPNSLEVAPSAMSLEGPTEERPSSAAPEEVPEPRVPSKKDTTLREFMSKMDDYAPVVSHHPVPLSALRSFLTTDNLPPPSHSRQSVGRLLISTC